MMMISDVVAGNLTPLYLGVIAAIKAYGVASGRNMSGWVVLASSTTVVAAILVAALTWDVSRKPTSYSYATTLVSNPLHRTNSSSSSSSSSWSCRGGICWHAVPSAAATVSQLRFHLPTTPRPSITAILLLLLKYIIYMPSSLALLAPPCSTF
ncbi:hypothetical protein Syun_015813 [Stephania yunnanensis]|uniref:Uncharacterized protein n=1 Tax=Stephania yunnanensis TaxID=152371 RepID=A0AAP0JLW9_9MAGN